MQVNMINFIKATSKLELVHFNFNHELGLGPKNPRQKNYTFTQKFERQNRLLMSFKIKFVFALDFKSGRKQSK